MSKRGEDIDRWEEALSWHMTLQHGQQEDLTSAVGTEWQNWYADSENRRTFDNVGRLLAERGHYRKRSRIDGAELESDSYDLSVPIAEWRNSPVQHKRREQRSSYPRNSWRWVSRGISVAALGTLAAFVMLRPLRMVSSAISGAIVYQTGTGDIKDLPLPDGSSVILGGRTKLSAAFSAQQRSVTLIEGQAWFKVKHNSRWPFVVSAGTGTITDIGTAFLVTRDADHVLVTVTDGTVSVAMQRPRPTSQDFAPRLSPTQALAPIRIAQGEEVAFGNNGQLGPVKRADLRAATSWMHGRLSFNDQPLQQVIESVNRYSSQRIAVTPSAGALRFSGIVYPDEIGAWLQGLPRIFPVSVDDRDATACVRMRNPPASDHESCANHR